MCKLLDNCLGHRFSRAGIIKFGVAAFLALAATAAWAQPTNDNFAQATVITGTAGSITGSNVGATAEPGEPDHADAFGDPSRSIWYQWTAPSGGTFQFNTEGSTFDTVLAVYTGTSVSALSVVASNDDVNFPADTTSKVTFTATNGTTYYIAVDGYNGTNGTVDLSWSPAGTLAAGQFQFATSINVEGRPTYIFSEHETFETIFETHMTRNGARARVTRTSGNVGLVHVSYTVTNTFYTNFFITNTFGTNIYITNTTTGTNFTNILITNLSITRLFADNVQGAYLDPLRGGINYCTNTNGTTITITNDDSDPPVRIVTNYFNPLPVPTPCRNTTNMGFVTNMVGTNMVILFGVTNVFCITTITQTNSPSAIAGVDYIPTNGVLDFKDYQMAADIPIYINSTGNSFNRVIIVTLNSATLDSLEPSNVISPPSLSATTNALVNVLSQESMGYASNLCTSTNIIFNFDKAVWTCTESVNGLGSATVWVVRSGVDATASGSVSYDIDFSPPKGADNNDNFALQPGSDYATPAPPLPNSPSSSQPADFTSVTGTVTFGAFDFNPKSISIPIVDDNIVEFNEDMHIRLIHPSGGFTGQITNSILTILFDDQPAGALDRAYNPDNDPGTTPAFNLNPGANKSTFACVIQPDGRAVIGGNFTAYNTVPRNSIARVNTDGSIDSTFLASPDTGANGPINALALDSSNNIYIGGDFTSFNGPSRYGVARLTPSGSLDTSFNPGVGLNPGGKVQALVLQPDGNLIIAGSFNTYNATNSFNVARILTNGSLDLSFNVGTGPNGLVNAIALQTNGGLVQVVIGGSFTSVNGTPRQSLARLNPDGSVDTTFNPGAGTDANTAVNALAVQVNGQLLVGGSFNTFNLINSKSIVRLNTDGSVDPSFQPGQSANDVINSIVLQPDGTILIGGAFTSYNETRRIGIARLFTTGALDTSFMDVAYNQFAGVINTYYSSDVQPKNSVNCMAIQQDGNIIISGSFSHLGGGYVKNADGISIPARDGYTPRQNFARLIGGTTGGPGNIGFAFTNYDADENGGNAFVQLNRSNGHLGPAGVSVSTADPPAGPGAAVTGTDYTFSTNYANPIFPSSYGFQATWMMSDGYFGPNSTPVDDIGNTNTAITSDHVYVSIIENGVPDGNRSLNLALSNPVQADIFFLGGENIPLGVALDATSMAPMEIINDNAPHGVIGFSSATYSVNENATNAFIDITRTDGSSGPITFTVMTIPGGTAAPGSTNDYLSISNVIQLGDTFTNTVIALPVVNNGVAKPDVTVFLLITNITGGASAGLTNAVLTIVNDNFAPGHLQFTSTNFGAKETDGTALITVSRTGGSSGSISVSCGSSGGTAVNGVNFSAATNILSWNAGDIANKTFVVPLFHDGQITSNLTVNLSLFNPTILGTINNAALGFQSNAVLNITNVDFYGQPTLSASAYSVNENAGFVTITVNRLGGSAQTMSVNYTTSDGTAFQNLNYTPVSGTLTFPPGVFSTNFIVPIIDADANPPVPNGNTAFTVTLFNPLPNSGPTGGATLGNPASATVTIIDNLTYNQPAGTVDATFKGYFDNTVYCLALQTNGELLAGGDFTLADGLDRNRIARLNADGTIDEKFGDALAGADNSVRSLVIQSDGAILIGGLFANVDNFYNSSIARLNYDGSLDSTFSLSGSGADSPVYAIAETFAGSPTNSANRRILIGGSFSLYNGIPSPNIAQLNNDGSIDTNFDEAGANGTVYTIAVYSTNDINTGKILIGGDFTQVDGITRHHIARLNADGTVDASFNPGAGPGDSVRAIAIQVDGNIVIGGLFTTVGSSALSHVARLTPNGLVDSAFNPGVGANDVVSAVALQQDQKIVLGGIFTQASGVTRDRITRLNSDGSLDPAINFGSGANNFVSSVVIQPDNKLVLGGGFTQFNGASEPYIARLYGLTTPGPGTLSFSSANYEVNEDTTNVVITVQRNGGTSDANIGNVYVQFATSDGTATSGVNYIGVTNTLTFPVGEPFATVNIPIISNLVVESNLTVDLTLSNPTDAALGAQPTAVLTIVNDNSDVSFSLSNYRVSKGDTSGEAVITVLRGGSSVGPASVDLVTSSNGTAIAGFDYLPTTNTVLFADGQTQETTAIQILTNSQAGSRTVGLVLGNPTNTILASPDTATLTIVDNSTSAGFVMFAATNYSVSEQATNAIIYLVRTNGTVGEVSVNVFTSGGTAVPGVDYAPTNATVTFDDTISNAFLTIPIFYNPQVTGPLTVNLTLTTNANSANGVQLVSPLTVPLTIQDADSGFAFDQPAYFVDETNQTVTIGVDLLGSTNNGPLTVLYSTTNGTAAAGTNYVATNGTLVFAPGQTFETFTVPIVNDPQITGNLTFFVNLSSPSAPGQLVSPATTAVTVLDDNTGFALVTPTNTVNQTSSNIVIWVVRTGNNAGIDSVNFATSDGTAKNGVRYFATNGVLVFSNGVVSNSFQVPIINDALVEGDQTFNVSLSNPLPQGSELLSPSNEVVTVIDDNSGFSFSSPTYSVAENGVTAFITVLRGGVTNTTVSVNYATTNLSANAGTQYLATNGTLTFTNGQTSATFGVGIIDNNITGGTETVGLQLSNPTPASSTSLATPNSAVLTIFNDDGSLIVPAGSYLLSGGSNNVIYPGNTVTMLLALRNSAGTNTTANFEATLLTTNGVVLPVPSTPVTYGVLVTNGPSVSRQFQFAVASTNPIGSTISATLQMQDGSKNLGLANFNFTLGQSVTSYTNTNAIIINDDAAATPYPSVINVSSLGGQISKVTTTVSNLGHAYVSDVCILLVGPGGQPDLLMAQAGGGHTITNVNLTFDDSSTNFLTTNSPVSGTYAPTAFSTTIPFPGPAPTGPYPTNSANIIGTSPNGTWSIYVYDDKVVDTGAINKGWSISISSLNVLTPTVDVIVGMTGSANPSVAGSNLTYTITVTNSGPAPASGVVLTDVLPPGVTFDSIDSSTNWLLVSSNTVVWNLGALPTNVMAAAPLVVYVSTNETGLNITNTVTAVASQTDANLADNSASVVTAIGVPEADLALGLSDAPDPIFVGNTLTYTIVVTNLGPATAPNVTVTDTLPQGLALSSIIPPGGTATTNGGVITVVYNLGSIGDGGTGGFTIMAVPLVPNLITNTASAVSDIVDPLKGNNTVSVKTEVDLVQLVAVRSGGSLSFSWPTSASGYVLQSSPTINPAVWSNVGITPSTVGGQFVVNVPITGGPLFFRLIGPAP